MSQIMDAEAFDDGGFILELKRTFKASRERIFEAFTTPEMLAQWWGPVGCQVPTLCLDVRPGGDFAIEMLHENGDLNYLSGSYDEVSPPEKLTFTWAWGKGEDKGKTTHVTLNFNEVPDGTEIILTHRGFVEEDTRDLHGQGWSGCFICLGEYLA